MTDKEIVQALRCCASGESEEECPFTEKYGCDGCPKVSADLIERLTDENAALREKQRLDAAARRAGGVKRMGIYDTDCDCVRADERFICQCVKCGRERLKKNSICVLVRKPYSPVKTLCYLCQSCYIETIEKLGIME